MLSPGHADTSGQTVVITCVVDPRFFIREHFDFNQAVTETGISSLTMDIPSKNKSIGGTSLSALPGIFRRILVGHWRLERCV